jgi:hypothetical protein
VEAFTVIFDACVLYPASLRDLLLELSTEGIFLARWTEKIHEEWTSNLLKNAPPGSPLTAEKLARTCALMNQAVPDCLVTGYERIIDSLELPDPDDRHVLAAAIRARASAIVTINLKDFPAEALAPFGIEAQHPDEFLIYQFDLAQDRALNAIKRLRARLRHPAKTADEYLDTLANLPLPLFVERLRPFRELI